jgi:hypothetical protein
VNEVEIVEESDAGEELLCKLLDVGAGEWDKAVGLEEVKDTLSVEIGDDADVIPEVEAIS